jgi:uncharacterized phiE125 gp8 family phage protein
MTWNRLTRVAAPENRLLTISELHDHLNVTFDDHDDYIEGLADVATAHIEGPEGIGLALLTQTWCLSIDRLPRSFSIPLGPVQSVDSITYRDEAGDEHTVDPVTLNVDIRRDGARVHCAAPVSNPLPGSVKVTFTTGFGDDSADVPADLRHAAKLLVGHFYENREATSTVELSTVPFGVECILNRYRSHPTA